MADQLHLITEDLDHGNQRMNRVLSREGERRETATPLDKIKVGIVGISHGAGVSFLTACLAKYLANTREFHPAVVELGNGCIFDSAGMDKRFAGREYFYFFKALREGRSIRGKRNMEEGINWVLKSPAEMDITLDTDQKLRLINQASGNLILCDCSQYEKGNQRLLSHMDQIIAVIDPLPSRMLEGYHRLCELKSVESRCQNVIYIINKYNRGINRREMMDFLRLRRPIFLPMVAAENIYTAEYICKIPYSIQEVRNQLHEPMKEIAESIKLY
ncbi:hypothetical protein [Sinanaerobacter chloroacetimidivorans]|jgi:hypothetical protein|uniref:Uncharacterized protein n=1 Tax=Sinanaerobacter chloroacetimidivorans TaxID=2818044 RepID=A0A8J8B2N6_9FIRM|nr:hypothetical protein [Sinanaerobacter chloroacetimidivorans]MBR0598931.1 hypothetical protein [Sinanaerobacter chloroacetimidivorans]